VKTDVLRVCICKGTKLDNVLGFRVCLFFFFCEILSDFDLQSNSIKIKAKIRAESPQGYIHVN